MRSSRPCYVTGHQAESIDYATARSGFLKGLHIIADSASSAVCGAPHTAHDAESVVMRSRAA